MDLPVLFQPYHQSWKTAAETGRQENSRQAVDRGRFHRGFGQSGTQFIPAMPGKTVIQGRANDRMPECVAFAPFLEEAQLQRAVQRIEEDRNVHRRFQCRRSGAELAQ